MIRARTYRLYPTAAQAERLGQWVGATRFVYNLALEQRRTFWRPGRRLDSFTQSGEVTDLRREADWLADVPRVCFDQALRDLDMAYRNWWSGRARAPDFRRRGPNSSFRLTATTFRLDATGARMGRLRMPKLGHVRCRLTEEPEGERRSVTIIERAGKWYASVWYKQDAAEVQGSALPPVGVDRGVAVFAALSTGEMIEGPRVGVRAARSMAIAQRRLARKKKGSKNYRKQRTRVARLHARVADARKDFQHKVSTTIAKNHGLVVLEKLNIRNMTASASGTVEAPGRNVRQKAGLNRSILDQGWGGFARMLAYKVEERGGHVLFVPPHNTSRTCAECGVVDADGRQGIKFSCRACGHEAHADTNAAVNILRRGTPLLPVEAVSAVGEAGTVSGAFS